MEQGKDKGKVFFFLVLIKRTIAGIRFAFS